VDVSVEGTFILPPDVQVAFYRIAQELLNNVAKHAQASRVTVRLTEVAGQVLLRVSDDGKGFDLQSMSSGHMGLGIIRERAAAIGATMEVDSRPGGGTVADIFWSGDYGEE
jgi:signal transduction histidine kinase